VASVQHDGDHTGFTNLEGFPGTERESGILREILRRPSEPVSWRRASTLRTADEIRRRCGSKRAFPECLTKCKIAKNGPPMMEWRIFSTSADPTPAMTGATSPVISDPAGGRAWRPS